MPFVNIDDLNLFYRERGSGPPLLLIMGFTANADWWPEELVDGLARNFRVLSIDNRASGRTTQGKRRFTIAQAAKDAVGFLDAMGIEKAHVFGVSMGGMIAQAMAANYSHRVDHLILGCTMARPRTGFLRGLPGQVWLAAKYLWNPALRSRPFLMNLIFTHAFLAQNPEVPRLFIEMANTAKTKPKACWSQLVSMIAFNGLPMLSQIKNPTLLLVGSDDILIAPSHSRDLQKKIPHAELQTLPGLGHAFVNQAPQEVLDRLNRFLEPATP